MKIQISRMDSTVRGTFGEMVVGQRKYYTVERPDLGNEPNVSCVPVGLYSLVPHSSSKYGHTWALVNHDLGVYHYEDKDSKRFAVLIHAANVPSDLEGCIGVGKGLGFVYNQLAVVNSRNAISELMEVLSQEPSHTLEIVKKEATRVGDHK